MVKTVNLPVPAGPAKDACCQPIGRAVLPNHHAEDLSRIFKALGDPSRLQLLDRIVRSDNHEACVCDLGVGLDLSQPTISHHLKVLHTAGLLEREKRGVWVHYRASREALDALAAFLAG